MTLTHHPNLDNLSIDHQFLGSDMELGRAPFPGLQDTEERRITHDARHLYEVCFGSKSVLLDLTRKHESS